MSEDEEHNWLRMLFYGPPGAGKTWLAASAMDVSEMGPVLFVNFDRGTKSIRRQKGITVVTIPSTKDADGWEEFKILTNWLLTQEHPFRTVILDSMDGLHNLIQRQIIVQDAIKKPDRDMDLATQNDWYKGMNRLTNVLELYKKYQKFHFIATCASKLLVDEVTTLRTYIFALPASLGETISGMFDLVAFMRAETNGETITRMFQTAETKAVPAAKDRDILNKPLMENVTMSILWARKKEVDLGV